MTAEIVNLRQARKKKARALREHQASENRLKHGQSKASRRHEDANKVLERKRLDGLIRDQTNANSSDETDADKPSVYKPGADKPS